MNILYRSINELTINEMDFGRRLRFYQSHYYDNIYYTSEDGKYLGLQNYQKEIQGMTLSVDPIEYGLPTEKVYECFLNNPGQSRIPVVKEMVLCGEYYDASLDGQILYKNIEDRAEELLPIFKKEIIEFLNGKHTRNIVIDTALIPHFRALIDQKQTNRMSPSEIILPILIDKVLNYFQKNGIRFLIVNGIMKKSMKGVSDSEQKRLGMSIEEVLQDSEFVARFCGKDIVSYHTLCLHKHDLNQLSKVVFNGVCNVLLDRTEANFNIVNGKRFTTDVPSKPSMKVHMFGPCSVMGLCVSDEMTICSVLQRLLNKEGIDVGVYNHGLAYGNDQLNDLLGMMDEPVCQGDWVIWFSAFEKTKELQFKSQGIPVIDVVDCVKGLKDWFLDNPFHCNGQVNTNIADSICSTIRNTSHSQMGTNRRSIIESMKINLRHDPYAILNSTELSTYEKYLEQFKCESSIKSKGAVVLNANPCTLGHLFLITEALKRVDFLYIFLVEENKGNLPYIDREWMLNESLKYNKRIKVIRGGSVMTSERIFPEYFNRSSKPSRVSLVLTHRCFGQVVGKILGVTYRFFGSEPNDPVTHALNESACDILPGYNIEPVFITRLDINGKSVSARNVRNALREKRYSELAKMVPFPTYKRLLEMTHDYTEENLETYYKNADYALLLKLVDLHSLMEIKDADIHLNDSCYPGKFDKYGCEYHSNKCIIKIAHDESQRLSLSSEKFGQILCKQLDVPTSDIEPIIYNGNVSQISKSWMNKSKAQFFPLAAYFEELLDSPKYGGNISYRYEIFKDILKKKCSHKHDDCLKIFWRVFIVDYLLCNARSAGNIGFISDENCIKLSPNYDNSTELSYVGDTRFLSMSFPKLLMKFESGDDHALYILRTLDDDYLRDAINYAEKHLVLNSLFEFISSKEDLFLFNSIEYRYNQLFYL